MVSLLWAPRKEAPVPAVMGWQHGHVGPVWLSKPMFVALGDLEKLFAFRASTKEMHDRKCNGYFFAVQQRRATYFSIQGFTGVDNCPASRIAPQFFLSHSGSGSRRKSRSGCIVFTPRSQAPPRMPVHARQSICVHCYPGALCRRARRRGGPSRGAYWTECLPHASYGGALTLPRSCVPRARLRARHALALII